MGSGQSKMDGGIEWTADWIVDAPGLGKFACDAARPELGGVLEQVPFSVLRAVGLTFACCSACGASGEEAADRLRHH